MMEKHQTVMERVKPYTRYTWGYKNSSALFRCPTCGHEVRQSLNYLGSRNILVCVDGKRKVIKKEEKIEYGYYRCSWKN